MARRLVVYAPTRLGPLQLTSDPMQTNFSSLMGVSLFFVLFQYFSEKYVDVAVRRATVFVPILVDDIF